MHHGQTRERQFCQTQIYFLRREPRTRRECSKAATAAVRRGAISGAISGDGDRGRVTPRAKNLELVGGARATATQ